MNKAQQEAVTFADTPLLILAGAGSGKTKVLTHRVAHFIKNGVPPENILLLTFTNRASGEMIKRVNKILNIEHRTLDIVSGGTYHSFCAKILRRYHHVLDLDLNFTIFDTDDQIDTIKQVFAKIGADPKYVKPHSVLHTISSAKNELIGPVEYDGFARGDFQKIVARIYPLYQNLLKQYSALDFDDLLVKAVELLKNSEVLESLQKTFTHVLVDEYQDTNKAQYQITKKLVQKENHLTCVGDFSQAIYSWRGADYKNMLMLKSDFPDLTIINLEQNYRSTQNILDAANFVVSKNTHHPILSLWTDRNSGSKITFYAADNEWSEAEFVASQIVDYKNTAILYRTNAQSRIIEEVFLRLGIPYTLVGGVRFYERKEIKDILAYIRLLIHPDDDVSKKRAEKIGKTRLNKLLANSSWFTETKKSSEYIDEIVRITGYLELYDPENEEDMERLENIKELRNVAFAHPDINLFLEQIALIEKETKKHRGANTDAVTLTTIHAAKGLEFKTVFIVGLEEGLFPHSRVGLETLDLEEERRLAYVAITRAMDKLYLTCASQRTIFGMRSASIPSRFLSDIPEHLLITSYH